jgi:hypothetical protein
MRTYPAACGPWVLATALGCGCTVTFGDGATSLDDTSGAGYGEAPRPPEPTTWRVQPPELTLEQQQRQAEVNRFLVDQARGYTIVETTQGYSGDIIDWVDSETLPGLRLAPPPPTWTQEDLQPPPGAELARTELDLYPELRGPAGTTPIHRPDFSMYVMGLTGAGSLQDYLENYQVSGQPSGQNQLYAGYGWKFWNMGASGNINQFQGDVEQGTFSLIEIAVVCPGPDPLNTMQMVGAVVSRDRVNFRDAQPRIHIEYMTRGSRAGYAGPGRGGWDERTAGFVPYPGRPYGPGGVVPASVPGLGTQVENRFDISQDASGNWWIAHNGNLLGHYPAELFDVMNGWACEAAWYGEIYDPTPTDWTWTDMGSGGFDAAGYGYAAYVRNPMYRDISYAGWYPDGTFYMPQKDDACYTRSAVTTSAAPWNSFFYLGGPGGDAARCD